MKYILTLDQGTTSSRAILFDPQAQIKAISQREFTQIYPQPGYVEHDPEEIWQTQFHVAKEALEIAKLKPQDIAAIGITNQRETTVIWDRHTGKPIHNAIVWHDRRTADICHNLTKEGLNPLFKSKTGLRLDPYFSGTKIQWILDNVPNARTLANQGKLAFGTIDSWLIWKLTGGQKHLIEISNASRTLLLNIHTGTWDEELLEILNIPSSLLPEICPSSGVCAQTDPRLFSASIPIAGIAGDQQAALFGQRCIHPQMAKNTYGTGCFLLANTGKKIISSQHGLLSTIAWKIGNEVTYAIEGSVFMGGAVVQWLRDGLKLIKKASEIEALAATVKDNGGVYLVPAFAGLGAPYWDPYARGLLIGLTRDTTSGHIAKAALESIAFQVDDVLKAMQNDLGAPIEDLRADGAASENRFLMQFQANLLNVPIKRPKIWEITALGAAYLAGLAVGFWQNQKQINSLWQINHEYKPESDISQYQALQHDWKRAVERSKNWIEGNQS